MEALWYYNTYVDKLLLSAAEGQRPRNYSSCCCSWIFCLIYALSTSTTVLPPFFNILNLSSSIFICHSINQPLPFLKYQYIIAADPGAGIGLVIIIITKNFLHPFRVFRG